MAFVARCWEEFQHDGGAYACFGPGGEDLEVGGGYHGVGLAVVK